MPSANTLPLIDGRPIVPVSFPKYVPEGVRNWAMDYLGHDEPVFEYRIRKGEQIDEGRDFLLEQISAKHRLIYDPRMKKVYSDLDHCFADDLEERDRKIYSFFDCAWSARSVGYEDHHGVRKAARVLTPKIAKAAADLAALLREARCNGLFPREFHDIASLLRQTDHPDNPRWRLVRARLLGAPWEHYPPPTDDPLEEERRNLGNDWIGAPSLPALLDSLAESAQRHAPQFQGIIGAALGREVNQKCEYLRAVFHLLREYFSLSEVGKLCNAVAITASVIINDQDSDIGYHDARAVYRQTAGG
jgi:hypothetical protein